MRGHVSLKLANEKDIADRRVVWMHGTPFTVEVAFYYPPKQTKTGEPDG